jgi:DNA-binding CsgD family transcriptional regulator
MAKWLDFERELAGVMELSDFSGSVLQRLQHLMGASGTFLSHYDEPGGMPRGVGGSLLGVMREYPPELFHEDPVIRWNRSTPASLFLATGQGFNLEAYARSPAYREFYQRVEIGWMHGIRPTGLPYAARGMFSLMITTPSLERCFDATRIARLRRLEVPLRAAAARMARFKGVQQQQDVLCRVLERGRAALILWDIDGRMIWASPAAQGLLGGPIPSTDLQHAAAVALRQLRRGAGCERDRLLGRPARLRSARGAPLTAEFSWLADAEQRPWLLAELAECKDASSPLAQLTRSEARVLQLLVQGLSNREISLLLHVSLETTRTHVKRILSKLGVSSRARAARIAQGGSGGAAEST